MTLPTTETSTASKDLEKIPGDRYEVIESLGTGAFGFVYKARDTFLNRSVAIKSIRLDTSLDPEQRKALNKRFIREAQVAAQLQHQNIVTIHDIMFTPETGFIVMEYIEGSTLQSVLEERGGVELGRAVDIVTQVARALHYAHDHKVIHRDIKPANIMITPKFEARITDFGIAKSDGATHLTHSGSLVGTPDYMSPEQAKGEEVDARTDLFSLGCVLYECVCGEKPFKGGSLTGVLLSIVNTDPFEAKAWKDTNVAPELSSVVERVLAKDPEQRYLTAGAFVSALEALPGEIREIRSDIAPVDSKTTAAQPETPEEDSSGGPSELSDDELASLKNDDRPLTFATTLSDDLQEMSLTPAQGYILSRIDGTSRPRDIIAVSPFPETEAARTLGDLIAKGLLTLGEDDAGSETSGPVEPLDDALVRDVERMLRLGREKRYSELLGINISTPTWEVKKSYLEIMQRFHPDAQNGKISESDRKKLSRVCAIATKALATVSGKSGQPAKKARAKEDPASTGSPARKELAAKLFKRARNAYDSTDFWQAIQLARQAIELDPETADYHHLLGLGLMKNQNWIKEAEESLRRAAELDAKNPEYFGTLATLYERQGFNERASKMAAKAKELDPSYAPS